VSGGEQDRTVVGILSAVDVDLPYNFIIRSEFAIHS